MHLTSLLGLSQQTVATLREQATVSATIQANLQTALDLAMDERDAWRTAASPVSASLLDRFRSNRTLVVGAMIVGALTYEIIS